MRNAEVERLARERGTVLRRGKVDKSAMWWAVVSRLGTGRTRALGGFRRTLDRVTC